VRRGLLDSLFADPLQWQEPAIFRFKPDEVHKLTVATDRESALVRNENKEWTWVSGAEPINQVNVQSLLNTLTVPDGQPLVWALRALGHPQASRIYGPELMARYCERAAATGVRMFLYGGRNQGALVQLVLTLRQRYPGLNIAGGYSPPFRPQTGDERDAIAAEINASRADVVWVGIGQPKQEKWMAAMRDRLDAPVLVGVGAAFDFHAGLVPQAPGWMQSAGLEWTYRLAHEPRRLWRRYARYNPRFVAGFLRQKAGSGRRSIAR